MLYKLDLKNIPGSRRVGVQAPHLVGIREKHIEDFFATHLNEIILEDQLMLIGQERQYQ